MPIARARCVVALLSVATVAVSAQTPAPGGGAADPLTGFDAYVAKAVRDWGAPGYAVAIVKDGTLVFAKGYGVRELGKPAPVDADTRFAIGSTTKALTAAAIGMLVDERKVAWDDPVVRHLPWFAMKDPWVTRQVTVRDLLTHRTGLGNADFLWYAQENGAREILTRVQLLDPAYSMRAGFVYQNIMYAAAGAVVEAASGMPWADFVQRRILDPLGMRATVTTLKALAGQPNVASPHARVDGSVQVIRNASVDGVAPAGSIWSSVTDMAKWSAFLLNHCAAAAGPLLTERTCDELFRPQTIVDAASFYPTAQLTKPAWTTYGLGWFQHDYAGHKVDFHTGSIDGMVAIHGLVRDANLGVYVLGNLDHAELRHALMYAVFDRFLGRPPRDWSQELLGLYTKLEARADAEGVKAEGSRTPGTSPSLPLARYAGVYSDPLRGSVVITLEGTRLRASYGTGFTAALEHWHYDTFLAAWEATWRGHALLTFVLDATGAPAALEALGGRFTREAQPSK